MSDVIFAFIGMAVLSPMHIPAEPDHDQLLVSFGKKVFPSLIVCELEIPPFSDNEGISEFQAFLSALCAAASSIYCFFISEF